MRRALWGQHPQKCTHRTDTPVFAFYACMAGHCIVQKKSFSEKMLGFIIDIVG